MFFFFKKKICTIDIAPVTKNAKSTEREKEMQQEKNDNRKNYISQNDNNC